MTTPSKARKGSSKGSRKAATTTPRVYRSERPTQAEFDALLNGVREGSTTPTPEATGPTTTCPVCDKVVPLIRQGHTRLVGLHRSGRRQCTGTGQAVAAKHPQSERRNETRHPDGAAAVAFGQCPQCKARKGDQCFRKGHSAVSAGHEGKRTPYVHAPRMARWDKAQGVSK